MRKITITGDDRTGALLAPGEVAALYRVDVKTVTRWARAGKFTTIRTPGGHRRFFADEVEAALNGSRTDQRPQEPRRYGIPPGGGQS
jgi:excisionase family DNA binding protein